MALHKIPPFLATAGKNETKPLMDEWVSLKEKETVKRLVEFLERKLEKTMKEEESFMPLNLFQSKYHRAAKLAERKLLRELISYFS
jgi:hypothetical protein